MVCRHIMFPPILKCAEGHNLCGKCCTAIMCGKSNSRKCPTCRIPLRQPIARSRNLEDWAIQVNPQVQCDFSCGARFCYASFGQHVQTCPGRTVTCPIKGCEWRGRPADLGKHLAANELPTSDAQSSGHGLQVTIAPAEPFRDPRSLSCAKLAFESERSLAGTSRWRPKRQLIEISIPKSKTQPVATTVLLRCIVEAGRRRTTAFSHSAAVA